MFQRSTTRYLWLLGAAVICASGIASGTMAQQKSIDKTQLYGPVIGDWKAVKAKRFVFYWSGNQASADAYQRYVAPLMQKQDPAIQLLLVQVLDNDIKDENGPGGLLLCPKNLRDYASLAIGYLKNGKNLDALRPLPESNGKPFVFLTNDTLDQAQQRKLFDPTACMGDDYFWARFVARLSDSKKFFATTPLKTLPQVTIGDTHLLPDDPRVSQFVRAAKHTP